MNETVVAEEMKKKFKLRKPNKKWTDEETVKILEFITETGYKFEKPSQQQYYNAMKEETLIDVPWSILKHKVFYMKTCYNNVQKWREGLLMAGLSEQEVNRRVLRTCPEYKRLNTVFGKELRCMATSEQVFKREDSLEFIENTDGNSICSGFDVYEDLTTDYQQPSTEEHTEQEPSASVKISQSFAEKRKISPAPFSSLRAKPDDTIKHSTVKCDKDLEMKEIQLKLEEEKLQTENKFRNAEFELKKLEIEKDEEIKRLEIEKAERIAMCEIKEKFKLEQNSRSQEFELKKLKIIKDESIKELEIKKSERIAMYEIEMKYKKETK